MRLLLLTNVFPSPWNPTRGTFNLEMAASLAKRHEVEVVAPVAWTDELRAGRLARGSAKRRDRQRGVDVYYPRFWFPPKIGRSHYHRFMEWSIGAALRSREAEFRPDAVLGYWAHPDGAVAVRSARRCGAAAWIMVGGSDVLLLAKDRRRGAAIRSALSSADGVVVVSDHLRETLIACGLPPDRVHVIYRGVDRAKFHHGDRLAARRKLGLPLEVPLFVWVGRMVEVKGLDVLVSAMAAFVPRQECIRLCLVGDGPQRAKLESQVQSLGLSKHVRFVGAVPHQELGEWYRAADWTVLSSHSEGVPNVLRESHACGTPFVATDVGGIREISLSGVDLLCPSNDAPALASALSEAVNAPPPNRDLIRASVPDVDVATEMLVARIAGSRASHTATNHSEDAGRCASL